MQVAIITGAGSGIGFAIAEKLFEMGVKSLLQYRVFSTAGSNAIRLTR